MIVGPSPRSARWPIGIAAFGLCLPFLIKNYGSARESAGNNRKEGVHVAAAPAPPLSQWGSSIASMILGALAAMAQTKVKRLLAHSSIGHVGYIRTGFSCGTIEGIQSLLIGGRVEPREALLRGRSLAPLHSLQGSKPFFNIGILAGKRALSNRYESLYKALSFPNSCVAAEMAVVRRLAGPNRIMKTRLVAAYSLTKESCIAVYLYAKYIVALPIARGLRKATAQEEHRERMKAYDIENRRKAESLSLLMLEALKTIPVWVKFSKQTPCPQVLEVFTDDKNFVEVEVEYQNKPQSCSICKIFGHNMYKCPKSNFYNGCPEEKTPGAEPSSMPSMEHKSVENEE
ncbi:hypothetical protein L1987_89700 [Smallanthus sonchifolius]|nr:hypothetical protein L1987_89700 [Smallanthus sonchifolius]